MRATAARIQSRETGSLQRFAPRWLNPTVRRLRGHVRDRASRRRSGPRRRDTHRSRQSSPLSVGSRLQTGESPRSCHPRSRCERVPMPVSHTHRRCRRGPRTRPFPRRDRSVRSRDRRVRRPDHQTTPPRRVRDGPAPRGLDSTAGSPPARTRRRLWPRRSRDYDGPRCDPPSLRCSVKHARTAASPRPAGNGLMSRRAQHPRRGPRLLVHPAPRPARFAPYALRSPRERRLAGQETPHTVPGSEEAGHARSVRVRK